MSTIPTPSHNSNDIGVAAIEPPHVPECDFSRNLYGMPLIKTPFARVPIIYADHTASGQPYRIIDDYLRCNVEPYYANTHSNAYCGTRMSSLIEQSRDCIRASLGAADTDAVIFTGSGSSAAIMHFMHILDILNITTNKSSPRAVVITTDIEHNSNYLPWSSNPEQIELVVAPTTNNGVIDLAELETILKRYPTTGSPSQLRIGSISAGSNITGVIQPVVEITDLLHKYGFVAAFDYAAVAPYVPINMHPNGHASIDAVYISPHKFLGGPGTPGLLVVAKSLMRNQQPLYRSGGTVRFASKDIHLWSQDAETRESGGTPLITGNIRCGLVFALKERLQSYITRRDAQILNYVRPRVSQIAGVHAVLQTSANQIPIFPLMFSDLHYNLAVVLFNDLFGIQTRGGISCSGVGAEKLLHLDVPAEQRVVGSIISGKGMPGNYGWCRVTFHYTMSDVVVWYIVSAIAFIAKYGVKFQHLYCYDPKLNNWTMRFTDDNNSEAAPKLDFDAVEPNCARALDIELATKLIKRAKFLALHMPIGTRSNTTTAPK